MATTKLPRKSPTPKRARAKAGAPTPREVRRERRREGTREEIVEAARRVLMRDGLPGATLDAVAKELGLTKAALYYYFRSKDDLLFEVVFAAFAGRVQAIHDEVERAPNGGGALRAIIGETIRGYAGHMDDFRLLYMHGQVLGQGPDRVHVGAEQLARIRPLNDIAYGGATRKLADDWRVARGRAGVEPRLMAFLANLAAVGVLTMKGMVESIDDPLLYSDEQLIDALSRIFEAAAAP